MMESEEKKPQVVEIQAQIQSITKDFAAVKVGDYVALVKKGSEQTEVQIYKANEKVEPVKRFKIRGFDIDMDSALSNAVDTQIVQQILGFIAKHLLPQWNDYLNEYEMSTWAELYGKTNYRGPPPRHSAIEELAKTIASEVTKDEVIKTFMQIGRGIIDIFCYDGVAYKSCRERLLKKIGELASNIGAVHKRLSKSFVEDRVMYMIEISTLTHLSYSYGYIAFENKLFNWSKFIETSSIEQAIESPNPDKIVFHRIPHYIDLEAWKKARQMLERYIPPRNCNELVELLKSFAPETYKYLESLAYFDNISSDLLISRICFLMQMIGRIMLPGYRIDGVVNDKLKNVFAFLGPKDTGKTTFLLVYLGDTILGQENYRSVNLARLTSSDPEDVLREIGSLFNVLMAVHADLGKRHKIFDWSIIRMISGGDIVKGRRLRKEAFEYYPAYKIAIGSNDPPEIKEMGEAKEALLSRMKVIEFKHVFTGKTPNIKSLAEEAPKAIIAYLYAANLMIKNDWAFTGVWDIEDAWLRYANIVYRLITEMIEKGIIVYRKDASMHTSDFYTLLQEYVSSKAVTEEENEMKQSLPDQTTVTKKLKEWATKFHIIIKRDSKGYKIIGWGKGKSP